MNDSQNAVIFARRPQADQIQESPDFENDPKKVKRARRLDEAAETPHSTSEIRQKNSRQPINLTTGL